MTEEYISGYLEAISRVKDIMTPYIGGKNIFFSIHKDKQKTLIQNIVQFISENKNYYLQFGNEDQHKIYLDKIQLEKIAFGKENFQQLIENWTCDKVLQKNMAKTAIIYLSILSSFYSLTFSKIQMLQFTKCCQIGEYGIGETK